MDGFAIETFHNAIRAIQPLLDSDESLAKRVSALLPLKEKEFSKILPCACSGNLHLVGKLPVKFPIFLLVCDRCGKAVQSR